VNDAVPVGILERVSGLPRDPDGVFHAHLPLAIEPVAKRFPFDERHRKPQVTAALPRIVDAEDVWMLQSRREADLLLESLRPEARRDFRMKDLEGDGPIVAQVLREEHRGKAAASELALDTILVAEYVREIVAYGQ
jgi:hypothetical protein